MGQIANIDPGEIGECGLITGGVVDSLAMIELAQFLEVVFNIGLDLQVDMRPEKFDSFSSIWNNLIMPKSPDVLAARGEELYFAGEVEPAAELFRAALRCNPDHSIAWNNYGVLVFECSNPQLGLEFMEKGLAKNVTSDLLLANTSRASFAVGEI